MDDLLKTYAKKRRDDAGEPMQMHPATRRLLQAEAAKLRPKPGRKSSTWLGSLFTFWPRLAFAGVMLVALGVTSWVIWKPGSQPVQTLSLAKQEAAPKAEQPAKTRDDVTRESLVRMEGHSNADSLSRPAVSEARSLATDERRQMTDLAASRPTNEAAISFRRAAGVSPSVVPPPTTPPPAAPADIALNFAAPAGPAATAASTSSGGVPGDQARTLLAESKDKSVAQKTDATALAAGKEVRLADELALGAAVSQAATTRFYKVAAGHVETQALSLNRFSKTQKPESAVLKKLAEPAAQVLDNFVVEQTGNLLRVVDADNSVYEGRFVDGPSAPTESREMEKAASQTGRRAPNQSAQSQSWNFRVSGTNRTLRQPVTLEGLLFEESTVNQAAPALQKAQMTAPAQQNGPASVRQQAGFEASQSAAQNLAPANLLNVRRIQGLFRVGATNQSPLDAVRSGN